MDTLASLPPDFWAEQAQLPAKLGPELNLLKRKATYTWQDLIFRAKLFQLLISIEGDISQL